MLYTKVIRLTLRSRADMSLGRHPNLAIGRHSKTGHRGVGAQDVDAAGGVVVPLASMTNILSDDKRKQVLALGRLGWTLRRIEQATGVRRETASAYLKAAGLAVRPPGRWGHRPAKPAIEVSTDPGARLPGISSPLSQSPPAGR